MRRAIASPTAFHRACFCGSGAWRTKAAMCPYPDVDANGRGTTMIASPPRLGNERTSDPDCPPKCSSNASGSGLCGRPGLSSKTNSNGRLAVIVVTGGVSQRNAVNVTPASKALNHSRKFASLRQAATTSEYVAEAASRTTENRNVSSRPVSMSSADHTWASAPNARVERPRAGASSALSAHSFFRAIGAPSTAVSRPAPMMRWTPPAGAIRHRCAKLYVVHQLVPTRRSPP